jgi:aminopeptidase N
MPYFSMLHTERMSLANKSPIVSGQPRTEEQVYDGKTGPGLDIYYKASLVLHTLRGLIGDDAFFDSIRRLVYGRPDPKPGNFRPRYASTRDYIDIVNQVTGKDLKWFFDVYLYDAALPRLETTRHGDTLAFRWVTGHGEPFPMPLDVQVGHTVRTLPMSDGRGELTVPAGSLLIVDPRSKVLREMPHVEAFQAWKKAQAKSEKKDTKKD